jgi:hypothetical protein
MRLRVYGYEAGPGSRKLLRAADEKEVSLEGVCSVANLLGKRFKCSVCNTEVLCVKAGDGTISCCGKNMDLQEARPLPSSD